MPSWLICSFPTLHPFRVSHLIIYVQSISRDISSVNNANTLHLATAVATTSINPMPGISWNSCCSPHWARRATHLIWSAIIFHGQIQSTVCPCEFAGSPPQGQLHCYRVSPWGPTKIPYRHRAHPFKGGISVAFTAHSCDSKCFHTVLSMQESQRVVSHHRTAIIHCY